MCITNNISLFTAFVCSLVLSFPVIANNYTCVVTHYSGGIFAVNKNSNDIVGIIKSWIPEKFTLSNSKLSFTGRAPLDLERPPKNGVYHAKKTTSSDGKTMRIRYRVNVNEQGEGKIMITAVGYKTLGPVSIKCKTAQEVTSSIKSIKGCKESVSMCSDRYLCIYAISPNTKVWETRVAFLKYVKEAKRRGLTCGTNLSNTTTSSEEVNVEAISKAKNKCSQIGYTIGTEKHADCVLKLLTD